MHRVKQLFSSLFFIVILLAIFFLVDNKVMVSEAYNIPEQDILAICFAFVVYIGYRYLKLELRKGSLEHEFTSIMNHTFRTPLTRIMWFAKELEKDIPQKDRLVIVQNIENATTKVIDIIDLLSGTQNIKDTSGYVFEAISIREIIDKSLNKYREDIKNKNITFQVPTFTDIPMLSVDLKKISFVVDTIIENAIHYTPIGGKIFIECISKSKKLTLYISDNGMGLTFRDKIRIFSKFYRGSRAKTSNTDGLGIRLYLSKQIIARHNGQIYAKSSGKDKGTTLFVELPFMKK